MEEVEKSPINAIAKIPKGKCINVQLTFQFTQTLIFLPPQKYHTSTSGYIDQLNHVCIKHRPLNRAEDIHFITIVSDTYYIQYGN